MRVALTVEQCWHEVPGGTARATIDLIAALADRGDLDLVGVAARHPQPPPAVWSPGLPTRHARLPRLGLYEAWHRLRRPRVESITGPVDVVHGTGAATPPSSGPLVVTVHDLAFRRYPEMFTRRGLGFFERALATAQREADLVLVPSAATLADCLDAGFSPDRCRVVPWGVQVPEIDDASRLAARRLVGPDADGPVADRPDAGVPDGAALEYVVVVGTLEPRKNLPRLFRAWEQVAREDRRLVVVGPDGWGDALGAHRPDGVVFTGFVPTAVRDALYAGARCSVYPSIFEGFGLPVLESLAAGCPVVAGRGTASGELLATGGGVTTDVTDVDALAAAIGKMLDDPTHRAEMASSTAMVAGAYTWEHTADLVAQAYRDVT